MPRTSVKIWQRSARRAAARATAVVSLPPRPSVVISWSMADVALWPWKPATMTTLPPSSSARTRRGSMPAMRARPYVPSVVMPACGPLRLIAGTPIAWSAIETRVALWCSPVASRTSSSRGSGSSVMPAASPSSSSVVSPIAETHDHEVVAGRALARDPPGDALDAIRAGDRRAAELLDDEGAGHRAAFYRHARRLLSGRPTAGARYRLDVSTRRSHADVLRPRQPAADRPDRGRGDRRRARSSSTAARRQPVRRLPRPPASAAGRRS